MKGLISFLYYYYYYYYYLYYHQIYLEIIKSLIFIEWIANQTSVTFHTLHHSRIYLSSLPRRKILKIEHIGKTPVRCLMVPCLMVAYWVNFCEWNCHWRLVVYLNDVEKQLPPNLDLKKMIKYPNLTVNILGGVSVGSNGDLPSSTPPIILWPPGKLQSCRHNWWMWFYFKPNFKIGRLYLASIFDHFDSGEFAHV